MTAPDLVALLASLITLFIYFVIGTRRSSEIESLDDFFYYGRQLDKSGYQKSLVVAGASLATVLFFFLDFGGKYGLPILLAPLMFCLGTSLLIFILPKLEEAGFLEKGTTLHSFLGRSFNSDAMRYSSAFVSMFTYLGIFVIELYVGVQIFRVFCTSTQWTVIVAIFIMSLVFIYTYLGGYKAVIDTDRLQFWLIVIGALFATGSLIALQFHSPKVHPVELFPLPMRLPVSLAVVLIVGNVPSQILRMSHWQRSAAAKDIKIIRSALKRGILWTFGMWVVFIIIGFLLWQIADLQKQHGATALLEILRNNFNPYKFIVYPVLFTAFVAALISTADTVFIAIINSYIYDIRHYKELHGENGHAFFELTEEVQKKGLKSARNSILFVLIAGCVLYYVLTQILHFEFCDLLFVIFLQQLVLFPALILAVKARERAAHLARRGVLCGIWAGWLSVWGLSIYSKQIHNWDLLLYCAASGWIVAIVVTIMVSPRSVFKIMWRGT